MEINFLKKIFKDESGATAIEYGLITSLVSIAIIGGGSYLGKSIGSAFNKLGDSIDNSQARISSSPPTPPPPPQVSSNEKVNYTKRRVDNSNKHKGKKYHKKGQ